MFWKPWEALPSARIIDFLQVMEAALSLHETAVSVGGNPLPAQDYATSAANDLDPD